jgi:phosphoglycolate phosphatase-like HAD superfamily hydrolase
MHRSPPHNHPPATVRTWLFDLDGTLVSSVERFHAAYCSALEVLGRPAVDESTFLARYRSGELITSLRVPAEATDGFWRLLMEFFLARGDLSSLLPGAAAALAELSARGHRIALVTGRASTEGDLRAELRGHGLDSYFDSVATLGDISRLSLSPAGTVTKTQLFARTCADLEVEPAAAALVTDWPAELDEGLEFGFGACVGVLTGGYRRHDFRADPRVSVVADLTEFADALAAIEGVAA